MQLHRFAVVGLSKPTPRRVLMLRYRSASGVEVTVDHVDGAEASYESSASALPTGLTVQWTEEHEAPAALCVHARVENLPAELDASGRVIVPRDPRRQAEAAIEELADMLAVAHQCRRTIRSPQTCVALSEESPKEFDLATELATGSNSRPSSARFLPELCAEQLPALIWDRAEGLRLLASGLSEESPAGRAREYYRLMEAAFGVAIGALKKPLYEFLKSASEPMAFTKKETDAWIGVRGKVMHADTYVASSADVVPFLPRLEWAAYDLILHKKIWGSRDVHRRPGPRFMSGPSSAGAVTVFQPHATIGLEPMDPFGVFATDRRAHVTIGGPGVIVNWPPAPLLGDAQSLPPGSSNGDDR